MDIPVPQVFKEFAEASKVFFQNRVQHRIVEQITETPAVSLSEEIVEAPKVQMQEEIICCLKENQSKFSEDAPLPSMPEEQIQEHIIEETDVPAPRVMEENSKVDKLKSQRFTLLAEKKHAPKLNGGCAVQAPEWGELQELRDEELVTIHDTNKLPNDNENLELFKEILPGTSLTQLQSDKRGVTRRTRAVVRDSSASPGVNLISVSLFQQKTY